jgi:glyoxylase-like metal-dependent hydrolase (beta-lactamase superfamily II)/rhodanese-related sulfurtransferase
MIVEQIYTGCLAQAAYYIENNGEAAIIDPLRDISVYINKAKERNAKIKYIFETHFHADFVSGHFDLAKATGAQIVYGPTARPSFDSIIAKDGEVFKIGKRSIKVLHTPGHTMESCCYLLTNENGEDVILFSGDTLFLGDVGRPDLAQNADITQEELAGLLYESIQDKILTLPDHIIIYPAHGAGSACGKNMSTDRFDTLGHQKKVNYALRKGITKREFIKEVTAGLTKPPQYFPLNVAINRGKTKSIDDIVKTGTTPLSVRDFTVTAMEGSKMILDARTPEEFAKGFIPGSINIGIDGDFAPWAGTLITDIKQEILIVCEEGSEKEVVIRLARVGYDNTIGYLQGGMTAWIAAGKPIDTVQSITAEELSDLFEEKQVATLLDVRKKSEFDSEHVIGAENVPLNYINEQISKLDTDTTYYVYCAGGYRSMIFISILNARGFKKLVNIKGGFKAIKENGRLFISRYQEPLTML